MISSFMFQMPSAFPQDEIRAYLDARPTVRRDRWDDAVRLFERRIDFSIQTRDVQTVREFALWLRRNYDVTVHDDGFRDITGECDNDLDVLFGKRPRRSLTD